MFGYFWLSLKGLRIFCLWNIFSFFYPSLKLYHYNLQIKTIFKSKCFCFDIILIILWQIWVSFTMFNKLISKQCYFFKISFVVCLVYFSHSFIIFFINNVYVYFQFHKSYICIMISFIVSCNRNLLFRKENCVLNFFLGKLLVWTLSYLYLFSLCALTS